MDYFRWSASPGTLDALARMNREIDIRHVLPAIRVPTLLLHGSEDRIVPMGAARWLADHISGATHLVSVSASHMHFGRGVEAMNAEVRGFLTELDESASWSTSAPDRVLATVLFTDIVDSSGRAAALGDRAWREVLEQHHALVRNRLMRFRGVEVDTAGDGFLASFDGPARAIACACAIVDGVRDLGLEVRAGLHTGECELVEKRSRESPYTRAHESSRWPKRMKCWSPAQSRISWLVRTSDSRIGGSTNSRAFPICGASLRFSASARLLSNVARSRVRISSRRGVRLGVPAVSATRNILQFAAGSVRSLAGCFGSSPFAAGAPARLF